MSKRTARALLLLTTSMLRRMFRESMVVRSLAFPFVLTIGTLLATLSVVAMVRPPPVVAVPPGFHDAALEATLREEGLRLVATPDPREAAKTGHARAGTDGKTVWSRGPMVEATLVESVLRRRHRDAWQLEALLTRPSVRDAAVFGSLIGRLLAAVFALYGVVIGAGMVARDRDDGTLGAEYALGIPRWIPGAARWLAASLVLTAFVAAGLLTWDALIGVPRVSTITRHAAAASILTSALGLYAVGHTGTRGAFAAPLAAALTVSFGLFALGQAFPVLALWLPIASIAGMGSGYVPLVIAVLAGAVLVLRFARLETP